MHGATIKILTLYNFTYKQSVDVTSYACITGEHTVHISKYANQKHTFFETVKFTGQLLELEKVNTSPLIFNSAGHNI
jgi:hypothetical protein